MATSRLSSIGRDHNEKDRIAMKQSRTENALTEKRPASVKPKKVGTGNLSRRQPAEDSTTIKARRAYEIYMERISRGPLDDWLEAEREMASHEPAE